MRGADPPVRDRREPGRDQAAPARARELIEPFLDHRRLSAGEAQSPAHVFVAHCRPRHEIRRAREEADDREQAREGIDVALRRVRSSIAERFPSRAMLFDQRGDRGRRVGTDSDCDVAWRIRPTLPRAGDDDAVRLAANAQGRIVAAATHPSHEEGVTQQRSRRDERFQKLADEVVDRPWCGGVIHRDRFGDVCRVCIGQSARELARKSEQLGQTLAVADTEHARLDRDIRRPSSIVKS